MLIATRAHSVVRSQLDIAQLFRISGDTLRARLLEFSQSPAAQLSLDDLRLMSDRAFEDFNDSWPEMDPPAYTRGNDNLMVTEGEEESVAESFSHPRSTKRRKAFVELYEDMRRELNSSEGPKYTGESLLDDELEAGESRERSRGANVISATESNTGNGIEVDEELDSCLLNDAEMSTRTTVWEKEYRDVLNARAALRKIREEEELVRGSRLNKSGKKRKVTEKRDKLKDSARQAVEEVLVTTSRKINYKAIGV